MQMRRIDTIASYSSLAVPCTKPRFTATVGRAPLELHAVLLWQNPEIGISHLREPVVVVTAGFLGHRPLVNGHRLRGGHKLAGSRWPRRSSSRVRSQGPRVPPRAHRGRTVRRRDASAVRDARDRRQDMKCCPPAVCPGGRPRACRPPHGRTGAPLRMPLEAESNRTAVRLVWYQVSSGSTPLG